ncbi:MAG: hypothetical protein Q9190_001757 [Brigantiaea leucoxantha]
MRAQSLFLGLLAIASVVLAAPAPSPDDDPGENPGASSFGGIVTGSQGSADSPGDPTFDVSSDPDSVDNIEGDRAPMCDDPQVFCDDRGSPIKRSEVASDALDKRGRPYYFIRHNRNFVFHIIRGVTCSAASLASTLNALISEAQTHSSDQSVPTSYNTFAPMGTPNLHITMNRSPQLTYQDLIDLANILLDLLKSANGGSIPMVGGNGFQFEGNIWKDDTEDANALGIFEVNYSP